MSRQNIIRIFLLQGLKIGFWGTLTGSFIGFIIGMIQKTYKVISLQGDIYFLDSIPIRFEIWHFAVVISTAMILSFLATLIPSYIASKIQPVKALRFK
jgi:lipoprotein-releasing system permease protein